MILRGNVALKIAGILVLLVVGSILSGAWVTGAGDEEVTSTPRARHPALQVLVGGDVVFRSLADQLVKSLDNPPKNRAPAVLAENSIPLLTVTEDGTEVVDIYITSWSMHWYDDGDFWEAAGSQDGVWIGLVRAYEAFALRCKGEFEEGDYYVWMGNADALGLELTFQIGWFTVTIEMSWFMALVNSQGEIVAILYPRDDNFYTPEQMLRSTDHPIISSLSACRAPEPEPKPEPEPEPPPPFP